MKVEFHKIAGRRYAVKILRENSPVLEMNPAPGFDDLMPHDMCHFIVEQVLKIENAIFGQITGNGNAGTFRNAPSDGANSKNDSRQRRKAAQKGKKKVKENLEDYAKSERATYVCWQNWLENSSDAELRLRAGEMKENAKSVFNQMSADEKAIFNEAAFARVRVRMSELSKEWQNLKIGEFMTVNW